MRIQRAIILLALLAGACAAPANSLPAATPQASPSPAVAPATATARPTHTALPTVGVETSQPAPTAAFQVLDPETWMSWPMQPQVSPSMRDVYLRGQANGLNPRALSIFGDCQSAPEDFLGYYVNNPEAYAALPPELQETVDHFGESLTRNSPTSQPGATAGALLWSGWPQGDFSNCLKDETPAACELRLNQPAFVIINIGTHYELRNERYMRMLVEMLLEQGSIPIITFKADNREGDHRINLGNAALAAEYQIPYWNLWAAVDELPGDNLYAKKGEEYLGAIYLNEDAQAAQRLTALQVLNDVWRAAAQP